MPALDKTTNLYAALETICPKVKAAGLNMSATHMASATVIAIINDCIDSCAPAKVGEQPKELSWLLEDDETAKKALRAIRDRYTSVFTASKNFQNTYLAPSGLMPKAEGVAEKVEVL